MVVLRVAGSKLAERLALAKRLNSKDDSICVLKDKQIAADTVGMFLRIETSSQQLPRATRKAKAELAHIGKLLSIRIGFDNFEYVAVLSVHKNSVQSAWLSRVKFDSTKGQPERRHVEVQRLVELSGADANVVKPDR